MSSLDEVVSRPRTNTDAGPYIPPMRSNSVFNSPSAAAPPPPPPPPPKPSPPLPPPPRVSASSTGRPSAAKAFENLWVSTPAVPERPDPASPAPTLGASPAAPAEKRPSYAFSQEAMGATKPLRRTSGSKTPPESPGSPAQLKRPESDARERRAASAEVSQPPRDKRVAAPAPAIGMLDISEPLGLSFDKDLKVTLSKGQGEAAGVHIGCRVVSLAGESVASVGDFKKCLDKAKARGDVLLEFGFLAPEVAEDPQASARFAYYIDAVPPPFHRDVRCHGSKQRPSILPGGSVDSRIVEEAIRS